MQAKEKNYAFIDSQNLNLGIQSLGWKLDYKRFRIYLREKYGVEAAYLFIGYIPENQDYTPHFKHADMFWSLSRLCRTKRETLKEMLTLI